MADMKVCVEDLIKKLFDNNLDLRWASVQGNCQRQLVMSVVVDYIVNLPMERYKEQNNKEICSKLLEKLVAIKGVLESDINRIKGIIE